MKGMTKLIQRYKRAKVEERRKAEAEVKNKLVLAGFSNDAVGAVIGLIVGVGVATLVLIFVGVIGGQTYQTAESQITAINNTAIRDNIISAIQSGFKSLGLTGQYLPIVVLAVIIVVVLGLILWLMRGTGAGYQYGGVL